MRGQYEQGISIATIAKRLGKSISAVYYQASHGKWKRPAGATRRVEHAGPKRRLEPPRRCEQCEQVTRTDPCQHCGTDNAFKGTS